MILQTSSLATLSFIMQTFLPFPDFAKSASCLDMRRLGKQRVEAKQIYLALIDPSYGWQNHPAVRMWRGHETALAVYGLAICWEWTNRGYKDTLTDFFAPRCVLSEYKVPNWVYNTALHLSHQSNLLRKDPVHYSKYFPNVPDNLPYIWPTPSTADITRPSMSQ